MSSETITKNDLAAIFSEMRTSMMLNTFYPIGSYYETSDTSFNPNTAWGGTWVLETEGQVHVSGSTNGTYQVTGAPTDTSDGGSKNIQEHHHNFTKPTYTIAQNALATDSKSVAHTHHVWFRNVKLASGSATIRTGPFGSSAGSLDGSLATDGMSANSSHSHSVPSSAYSVPGNGGSVDSVAGTTAGLPESSSEGNMPPYIIVNRWHRTA